MLPYSAEGSNQDLKLSALPRSCRQNQRSSYDQTILKSSVSHFVSPINQPLQGGIHFISLNQDQVNAAHHWEVEKE